SMRNRALIALITIVAAIFGSLAITSLKQELIPSVEIPQISIVSVYQGASPDVVNTDVSTPIETAIQGITGLDATSSTSSTGLSVVTASFVYGTDLTFAQNKLQTAVNRIQTTLPDGVTPNVLAFSTSDIPVVVLAVSGVDNVSELTDTLNRTTIGQLQDLDGVRAASLFGDIGKRVTITPDVTKLAQYGLTSAAFKTALQQNGLLIPGGTVDEGDSTYAIQIGSKLTSVEDISALPLVGASTTQVTFGTPVKIPANITIADVATVQLTDNPVASYARVNGEDALSITITAVPGGNTVDVSKAVRAELPKLQDELQSQYAGATITVVFDQAPYIQKSIDDLAREGLLGLAFAVIVILLFLFSVRATLVTAISIPTSVLITFIGLQASEYSLNILTLGALTIAIGRVVDDAIVVIENIKRHLVEGVDKAATIVRATKEVAGAITASTLTTVAVFLPIALVNGITGELFRPFAVTVTIALLASLFVALTIIPVLAYWFLKPTPLAKLGGAEAGAAEEAQVEAHTRLQKWYEPVLRWTLGHRAITLLVSVAILVGTIAAAPLMKTNFLSNSGQNTFTVAQTMPVGTSLTALDTASKQVEQVLLDTEGVVTVQTSVGGRGANLASALNNNANKVNYSVTTEENADQVKLQQQVRADLDALGDGIGRITIGAQSGFGNSDRIEIDIKASNDADLRAATDAVLTQVNQLDGMAETGSNLSDTQDFVQIVVNREKAAAAGYSEVALASIVAGQTQPSIVGSVVIDENTLKVYVQSADQPSSLDEIKAIEIATPTGVVRLDSIADVAIVPGPTNVTTVKGLRSATVYAIPDTDNVGAASAEVTQALTKADLPKGTSASIGGVASDQSEAFGQLGLALLAAILIVYVIMVATFGSLLQPLLLLVSIPFAATGAIALQIITGVPLGVPSLIGALMLIGIVVTNAIVLIDLVNQYRRKGLDVREAMMHGASRRLRPILMTAFATVFALLPMAAGIGGGGGFISQPLAIMVIGGLVSSTLLTLVVLPTLYVAVEGRRERRAGRRAERRG
ncbi:MAG: efflux RND transporter permease subunit, partial [Agromyces sp.]